MLNIFLCIYLSSTYPLCLSVWSSLLPLSNGIAILPLSLESSSYTLVTSFMLNMWFVEIFLIAIGLSSLPLNTLTGWKYKFFNKDKFILFSFMDYALVLWRKTLLKSWKFSPVYSYKSFIYLLFTLNLWSITVNVCIKVWGLNLGLFLVPGKPIFQHDLLKISFFLHWIAFSLWQT